MSFPRSPAPRPKQIHGQNGRNPAIREVNNDILTQAPPACYPDRNPPAAPIGRARGGSPPVRQRSDERGAQAGEVTRRSWTGSGGGSPPRSRGTAAGGRPAGEPRRTYTFKADNPVETTDADLQEAERGLPGVRNTCGQAIVNGLLSGVAGRREGSGICPVIQYFAKTVETVLRRSNPRLPFAPLGAHAPVLRTIALRVLRGFA